MLALFSENIYTMEKSRPLKCNSLWVAGMEWNSKLTGLWIQQMEINGKWTNRHLQHCSFREKCTTNNLYSIQYSINPWEALSRNFLARLQPNSMPLHLCKQLCNSWNEHVYYFETVHQQFWTTCSCFSSGSSCRVRGRGQEHEICEAIFLWLIFTGPGRGGMTPLLPIHHCVSHVV